MKKIFGFLVLCLLSITPIHSNTFWDKVKNMGWFNPLYLLEFSYGTGMGGDGFRNVEYKPYHNADGVYINFLGFFYEKGSGDAKMFNSTSVGVWDDTNGWYEHKGFTIPICKYLQITPLKGTMTTNKVIVDGYDYSVGSSGIMNKCHIIDTKKYKDNGVFIKLNVGFLNTIGVQFGYKLTKHQKYWTMGVFANAGEITKRYIKNNKHKWKNKNNNYIYTNNQYIDNQQYNIPYNITKEQKELYISEYKELKEELTETKKALKYKGADKDSEFYNKLIEKKKNISNRMKELEMIFYCRNITFK